MNNTLQQLAAALSESTDVFIECKDFAGALALIDLHREILQATTFVKSDVDF